MYFLKGLNKYCVFFYFLIKTYCIIEFLVLPCLNIGLEILEKDDIQIKIFRISIFEFEDKKLCNRTIF